MRVDVAAAAEMAVAARLALAVVMLAVMVAGATVVTTAAEVEMEDVTTATTARAVSGLWCAHTPCCPQYPWWY